MISSLFTSITGLSSQSKAMGVISDNIANINTIGFKSSRFSFADILSASIGGATNVQVGGGVRLSSVLPNFIEGSIVTTGNPTDLAIDGNGFFIVSDGSDKFYTRAGQFVQNVNGELTTPEGYVLQGWNLEDNTFGNINLSSNVICPPKATEKVELKLNLCSEAKVPATPFDATNISSDMYNYSTSVTVYDSEGSSHEVTIYFVKTADNAWTAHYVYTQADGTVAEAGTQNLTFNDGTEADKSAGSLSDDSDDTPISFDFGDITFDYGKGTDETPPKATEKVELKLNLCSEAEVPATPFDVSNISSDMYNYSTSVTVYDSEGSSHEVTIYFVKTADNAWTAHYVYTKTDGTVAEAGTQNLTFNDGTEEDKSAGSLKDDNSGTAINFDFGDITFNYGKGTDEGGNGLDGTTLSSAACTLNSFTQDGYGAAGDGLDGTTQFCSACTLNSLTQDGYGAGSLKNISIDEQGVISVVSSNGELKKLYQIILARFSAPCYLQKIGDNLYEITDESGQPINFDESGQPIKEEYEEYNTAKIIAGSLEQSNVDIAKEFINMILVQRAFQANSKVITTSDIMLDDLIRMKR